MKKLLLFLLVGFLIGGSATIASANLIINPGFEDNNFPDSTSIFDSWISSGLVDAESFVSRSGSFSAYFGSESASIYQIFSIPTPGTYEYGAWFKFSTFGHPSLDDFGSASINAKIMYDAVPDDNWTGGDINSNIAISWTEHSFGWWQSDWVLLSGVFDVLPGYTSAQLRINFSTGYPDENLAAGFRVDDTYVRPVPEPTTMLLLSSGIIGLAALGRKKFLKK